jgi:predicted amino acid racemase
MEICASGSPFRADVAMNGRSGNHLVLAIRGQIDASLDDYVAFSRHFGKLAMSPPSPVICKRVVIRRVTQISFLNSFTT